MSNLKVWDQLKETDPNYTKQFDKGTYKGTAINPTYAIKKMTELYGAAGTGWYFNVVSTEVFPASTGDVLVYREVELFTATESGWSAPIRGIGGEYVVRVGKNGPKPDDDAFKKATTDALTNAMKALGMSADIFMGEYDDNKYVNGLKEKYKDEPEKKNTAAPLGGSIRSQIDPGQEMEFYNQALKSIEGAMDWESLKKVWAQQWKTRATYTPAHFSDIEQKYNERKQEFPEAQQINGAH